jgi:sensor domain CHASE-containing protein
MQYVTPAIIGIIGALLVVTLNWLSADVRQLRHEIDGLRADVKSDINGLRAEVKSDINSLRTEVKSEINGLRAEIEAEMQGLCSEIRELRNDLKPKIITR